MCGAAPAPLSYYAALLRSRKVMNALQHRLSGGPGAAGGHSNTAAGSSANGGAAPHDEERSSRCATPPEVSSSFSYLLRLSPCTSALASE